MKVLTNFVVLLAIASLAVAQPRKTGTYGFKKTIRRRKLRVTREYEIPVEKGKRAIAAIPALMSFWGATNEQAIQSSRFHYSVEPNKIEVTSDNLGMRRRNYELTWNSPPVDKINVKQTLTVNLKARTKLYTAAKLPYSDEVRKRFARLLGKDDKNKINPDNPELEKICSEILKNSRYAEDVVEQVCDWINDNITFKKIRGYNSDEILKRKQGSCSPMSLLACAMLRRLGIPAENVRTKNIGNEGAHAFIEVYFPDAGWVFYDLANHERGFKTLDCLFTPGRAFRIRTPNGGRHWVDGNFSKEKDLIKFAEDRRLMGKPIRKSPNSTGVLGAKVTNKPPPKSTKSRHLPLSQIIMDTNIPPGKREYILPRQDAKQQPNTDRSNKFTEPDKR